MPIEHKPDLASLPGCSEAVFDAIHQRHLNSRYHSPFQVIKERFPLTEFEDMCPVMQYDGTLDNIIDELSAAIENPNEYPHFYRMAIHPPLITRGVIDWKIAHSNAGATYVKEALELAMSVYKQEPNVKFCLAGFRRLIQANAPKMLNSQVTQIADFPSWHGTDPSYSYNTALDLAFTLEGSDILLIPLGHGATAAGIDVFLRYVDITQSQGSHLYVARFSRNKKRDFMPQLSTAELRYLQALGTGKQVVIFEEDCTTHRTMNEAYDFFHNIFPRDSVSSCCNLSLGNTSNSLTGFKDSHIFNNLSNITTEDDIFSYLNSSMSNKPNSSTYKFLKNISFS